MNTPLSPTESSLPPSAPAAPTGAGISRSPSGSLGDEHDAAWARYTAAENDWYAATLSTPNIREIMKEFEEAAKQLNQIRSQMVSYSLFAIRGY